MSEDDLRPSDENPRLKIADGSSGFSKACFEIFQLIQEEQTKEQEDNGIINICSSMESLLDEGERHALAMMRTMDLGCIPTYILLSTAGRGHMIPMMMPCLPEKIEDKMALISPLSLLLTLGPIDAYIFISEVWMANYEKDQIGSDEFQPPSQRPDRKEALMIHAFMPGKTESRMFDIIRGDDKKDVQLKPVSAELNDMTTCNPCMQNLYQHSSKIMEIARGKQQVH